MIESGLSDNLNDELHAIKGEALKLGKTDDRLVVAATIIDRLAPKLFTRREKDRKTNEATFIGDNLAPIISPIFSEGKRLMYEWYVGMNIVQYSVCQLNAPLGKHTR